MDCRTESNSVPAPDPILASHVEITGEMMATIINKFANYISQINKNDVIAAFNRLIVYSAATVTTASILGLGAYMMYIKSNYLYPDSSFP